MPAEPTKAKLKRRSSRKELTDFGFDGSHVRELELKRTRGEVSCAECRRLKIKCDKQIPCQSCIRRGCVTLCPNGTLATGQGTRFVLAATEHLHHRIAKLNSRIRQLEDALRALHEKHSIDPHPLLHRDLLSKDDLESPEELQEPKEDDLRGDIPAPGEIIDAFGTLSVSENGVTRFFGPTGGSESLLMSGSNPNEGAAPELTNPLETSDDSQASTGIGTLTLFSRSFPFTPVGKPPQIQEVIESNHLPSYETAVGYLESYFTQVGWLFRCVTRAQVMDDMLPVIYKRVTPVDGEDYSGPHDLALLFTLFAVACFVGEDEMKPYSDHFFQISRVALSLRPILEKPSLVTIQVLDIQSIYIAMTGGIGASEEGGEASMETTWSLITLASNLSQTIGLHRDSTKWGLSPKIVQRRSILFWDLFVSDVWQSLNTGRPPSISLAYANCPFPKYEDAEFNPAHAFEVWQARFAAEVVMEVAAKTLTTEAPSYSTIMALDRKIREFPNPDSMSESNADFSSSSQRNVLDHVRETVLLYIHRSFFAQAIIDHPENPLKSPYAPSFLAAYKAATIVMEAVQDQFERWPRSCAAFWTMWTFAFSSAVVFGTVVTRGPRSPLAKSAMRELEQAFILFSKAAEHSIRASRALPVLKKLAEKARYALKAAQNDPSGEAGAHWTVKQEDTEDELAIFMGRTRFVNAKRNADRGLASHKSQVDSQENSPPMTNPSTAPSVTAEQSRAQPTAAVSHTNNDSSQPITSVDVSMHGPNSGWATESYDESRPSSGVSDGSQFAHDRYQRQEQYHQYQNHPQVQSQVHPGSTSPPDPIQPPVANYNWNVAPVQGHSEQYEAPPAMVRPRQYSINPSIHHEDQYYDSGPSTVPINYRSQTYYSTQQHGYPQRMYPNPPNPHPHHTPSAEASSYVSATPASHYTGYTQGGEVYPRGHQDARYGGYQVYPTTPAFNHGAAPPANPALEEMGMVSRDSRLDQRWSSFVSDTGILEGYSSYRQV